MYQTSINILGNAFNSAYLFIGKLNTCYSPNNKMKEVHKNLPVGMRTSYVEFRNQHDNNVEELVTVIHYIPSTLHFSVHLCKLIIISDIV